MKPETKKMGREIGTIIVMAVLLALVYNSTSRKGIPLIRSEVKKVAVTDSALFPEVSGVIPPPRRDADSTEIPVIAPLHEKAMRNPDSMAQLYPHHDEHVMKVVTLLQFKRLVEENRAILIDARDRASYTAGHIRNAWSIPGLEVDQYFEKFVSLPRDTMILIYCNNPDCHLSRLVGDFLGLLGFTNLYHFDGGYDEWTEKKMPVDVSARQ